MVKGKWSRDSGEGIVVKGQWSRDSGQGTVVKGQWSSDGGHVFHFILTLKPDYSDHLDYYSDHQNTTAPTSIGGIPPSLSPSILAVKII